MYRDLCMERISGNLSCVSIGDETEIPRRSSFFSDTVLASSSGLLTFHSSLNFTGDEKTLDEDVLNHDGFGDEGVARDMIGKCESNSLSTTCWELFSEQTTQK